MSWSLAPGDVLSHYRVLSPLGSGGMGQVYLAEDVRLGRKLALKVLLPRAAPDENRLRRFEREARTISALNHPNILTIYDVGHAGGMQFIATEYIDGVTLRTMLDRGRLDVPHALDIAIQVVQALEAAHDADVIHRDLKPENVMVRSDGYVKVLDFGLAKITSPGAFAQDAEATTRLVETNDGVVLGSFSYMAPEQARGAELDPRVDLFACGVLLYEMLAGERPFTGATPVDVLGALLYHDPKPLARLVPVPRDLDRIVTTAIRKDRDQRYQTSAHLLQDLQTLRRALESGTDMRRSGANPIARAQTIAGVTAAGTARAPVRPSPPPPAPRRRRGRRVIDSLAVLPLVNHSHNQELEYLSDGLTESLINNLSQLPHLRVMARSTVFRYKGRHTDPQAAGRDLAVQAVLTGRILQRGDSFIVGAELVDVDDGAQLWGTLVNRRPSDVFVLQADISRELTDALRLRLTRDERKRLNKRHTVNPEAYQLYLRGRYFVNKRTGDALREARVLFERAVREDPAYALAHAGLADCCSLIAASLRTSSAGVLVEEARVAALKALELDDVLAEGHASLAFIKFRFDWDWEGAEAEFTRAIDLNPGHAPSRQWHAMFLASRARFETALAEMMRALELDPLSLIIQTGLGRILHFSGRLDEAVVQYEHVLQADPGFAQARVDLALTRLARGEFALTRAELDRAEALVGPVSTILLLKGICAVREGRLDEGRAAFNALRERYTRGAAGPDDLAMMAAVLGDYHAALEWLKEACERRAPFLGYVSVEPAMALLHQDPDCRALLHSLGFRTPA
jgi:serine/threonine protein kinase/tetratricopeptide (TPR) repeat protein